MKDLRDPQKLGEKILYLRTQRTEGRLSEVIDSMPLAGVPDFDGGGLMSNDPALHHSKTPQDVQLESDRGGE